MLLATFRNILFLLLFGLFALAGHASVLPKLDSGNASTPEIKAAKKQLSANRQHKPAFKLQHKPKGTEVLVPHFSKHTFRQFFTYYNGGHCAPKHDFYFSFGYSPGKRGPPGFSCQQYI